MRTSRWLWWVGLVGGCAEGSTERAVNPPAPDAAVVPCTTATYYADRDTDGHGDPASAMEACTQPPNTTTTKDDCDDTTALRRPGLAESCDALDNDCDPSTLEVCPASCTAMRRPPPSTHVYLVCNVARNWNDARSTCASAGFKLAQIDDAAEDGFVRMAANAVVGANNVYLGGNDIVTDASWTWDGGDAFWLGNQNGAPVGGRYARWAPGEPNNDRNEDCAEQRADGLWNDVGCTAERRFVCRK